MVDSECVEGYKPHAEFVEVSNEALVDLNLTDSTELLLLNLPFSNDFLSDINGRELSLNLHNDGKLASFEGPSGKVYHLVSFAAQESVETVFVSSTTEPKIAGNISQRVSVVHYPDPEELVKLSSTKAKLKHQNSVGVTKTTSSRYFPEQSGNRQSSQSTHAASSKGSRQKSSLSEVGEASNTARRKLESESTVIEDPSMEDISCGRNVPEFSHGHITGISSMSYDHSHGGKSKRRKHKK